MNLSLMSVGNKQINPGLTYFILTAAELDSIILPSTESAISKDKLQNVHRMQIFAACVRLLQSLLTAVGHLEKVVLFKLLEYTSFNLHKLKKPTKNTYVIYAVFWLSCNACTFN